MMDSLVCTRIKWGGCVRWTHGHAAQCHKADRGVDLHIVLCKAHVLHCVLCVGRDTHQVNFYAREVSSDIVTKYESPQRPRYRA